MGRLYFVRHGERVNGTSLDESAVPQIFLLQIEAGKWPGKQDGK